MSSSRAPLRFVHASNLLIDHQLRDTGPISEDTRPIIEDATLRAFDNLVAACLHHAVDFLLLTGPCIEQADFSIVGPAALRSGFARLADHNIPVYVACDLQTLHAALRAVRKLSGSVYPIFSPAGEVLRVAQDQKRAATVQAVAMDHCATESSSNGHSMTAQDRLGNGTHDFRIGVVVADTFTDHRDVSGNGAESPLCGTSLHDESTLRNLLSRCHYDYLALPSDTGRRTLTLDGRIAHHPGSVQPLSKAHVGPHGCTLVEIDAVSGPHCLFLPTAPVRFECLTSTVTGEMDRVALVRQMNEAFSQLKPEPTEQVWILEWTVDGSGPLMESLEDRDKQRQLIQQLDQQAVRAASIAVHHRFRFDSHIDLAASGSRLAAQFMELANGSPEIAPDLIAELLEWAELPYDEWHHRFCSHLGELDRTTLGRHARRLGRLLVGRAAEDISR